MPVSEKRNCKKKSKYTGSLIGTQFMLKIEKQLDSIRSSTTPAKKDRRTRWKQQPKELYSLFIPASACSRSVLIFLYYNIKQTQMKFPAVFVNHGGGPLPLMGRQPVIAQHMKELVTKFIPDKPRAIVVISAHYEANPITITSSANPSMYFDYSGFPPETYKYTYPAKGHLDLARKIQKLLSEKGLESELDDKRGFDHGVFVPLMLMYPAADIPVVCVSLHSSLSADIHLSLGKALAPLQDEGTSPFEKDFCDVMRLMNYFSRLFIAGIRLCFS